MKYIFLLTLLVTAPAWAQGLSAQKAKKLDNDIRYLVGQQSAYGDMSVAVVDSSGVKCQVQGDKPYPLASVFKLPLLLAILDGQDNGSYPSMGSSLTLTNSDLCIGSGNLIQQGAGSTVSVDKAARLMMSVSDNTATDVLFRRLGCNNLDPWLHQKGFKSAQILLTNRQAWLLSLGKVPGWGKTTPEQRVQRWEKLDRNGRLALAKQIEDSAKGLSVSQFQAIENASTGTQTAAQDNLLAARLDNKMSALDLARMMVALDQGTLISEAARKKALNIIAGQQYHTRLPKNLASTSDLYHKTGTLSGIRCDAGLLYVKGRDEGIGLVFLSQNIRPGAEGKMDNVAAQIGKLVEQAYSGT